MEFEDHVVILCGKCALFSLKKNPCYISTSRLNAILFTFKFASAPISCYAFFKNLVSLPQSVAEPLDNTFTLEENGSDVLYLGLAFACWFTCVVLFDRRRFLMARELPNPPSTCQQQEGTDHQLKGYYSGIISF